MDTSNATVRRCPTEDAELHPLDSRIRGRTGVTFGVPWARGQKQPTTALSLSGPKGEYRCQWWPTAYWPDGSVKWTAIAAVVDEATNRGLVVQKRSESLPEPPIPERPATSTGSCHRRIASSPAGQPLARATRISRGAPSTFSTVSGARWPLTPRSAFPGLARSRHRFPGKIRETTLPTPRRSGRSA